MSKVYLKVPPEEHGALCKPSPLRDRPMCGHARKAQGQATEPSKVPTAGTSSFVVAPMGSCYVVLYMYWLSRQFQEDNSTSADDASVLSLASLVFSVVMLARLPSLATLSLPACCRLLFWRSPSPIFHVCADSTRSNNRICISLPSFRNPRANRLRQPAQNATESHHSRCRCHCLPTADHIYDRLHALEPRLHIKLRPLTYI